MNKTEYLRRLKGAMRWSLTAAETADILLDCEGFFFAGSAEGKSEAEICANLGRPGDIARDLLASLSAKSKRERVIGMVVRVASALALVPILLLHWYAMRTGASILLGNVLLHISVTIALWFVLGGTPSGKQTAARTAAIPPKTWLFRAGHLLMPVLVAAGFVLLGDMEPAWLKGVSMAEYGSIALAIINALRIAAVIVGVLSVRGFFRSSLYYFTLTSHAVGVLAFYSAVHAVLGNLSDPSTFQHAMSMTLVVYAASIVVSCLFAALITGASRRHS